MIHPSISTISGHVLPINIYKHDATKDSMLWGFGSCSYKIVSALVYVSRNEIHEIWLKDMIVHTFQRDTCADLPLRPRTPTPAALMTKMTKLREEPAVYLVTSQSTFSPFVVVWCKNHELLPFRNAFDLRAKLMEWDTTRIPKQDWTVDEASASSTATAEVKAMAAMVTADTDMLNGGCFFFDHFRVAHGTYKGDKHCILDRYKRCIHIMWCSRMHC